VADGVVPVGSRQLLDEPVRERFLAYLRDRYGIDLGRGDEAQCAQVIPRLLGRLQALAGLRPEGAVKSVRMRRVSPMGAQFS
jgi:hypothetical protein